ncbi:hypothetical protein NE865_03474 [Phthorimaea operculella]|nr:hypothetical protein NE865_03474 [Phthorimaea operculella]
MNEELPGQLRSLKPAERPITTAFNSSLMDVASPKMTCLHNMYRFIKQNALALSFLIFTSTCLFFYLIRPIDQDYARQSVENSLRESLKEDKGTGCEIPQLDPFSAEIMKFNKNYSKIKCVGYDWVKCYFSTCALQSTILKAFHMGENTVECEYRDIIYESDRKHTLGPPTILKGNKEYELERSDYVKIHCKLDPKITHKHFFGETWSGHGIGYRPLESGKPPPGRENTPNILIFAFDSTAKNGFIRKMHRSYKFLTEVLNAVVLNGYNIVGDGTAWALFPLLTGKTELELPESRKSIRNSGYLDDMPFIFYKLKKDGYRTAYFEDMPKIGTFQHRFNGFRHQPTDHYIRDFFLEADNFTGNVNSSYCIGDTPRYKLMMDITDQFFKLDGKRFAFTFVADITHYAGFNKIASADGPFVDFLNGLLKRGVFNDTLLVVMGDHGPRYDYIRQTLQGRLEERLPLLAIRLPDTLKATRPEAFENLRSNVDTLTTVHDLHATILDVLDMRHHWNKYKVPGADLTRGLTLLEKINKSRSCSEAGIETHWCTCVTWEPVRPDEPLYNRTAKALLDHINRITESQRSKCAIRTLKSIDWVTRKRPKTKLLQFKESTDFDKYLGRFGRAMPLKKFIYQVKITVGPGVGVYEGAVTHHVKENKFSVNTREISRTNA